MKKAILFLTIFATAITSFAQYQKIFYLDKTFESEELSVTIENIVSTDAYTKFKLTIQNKTANYYLYKPEESKFVVMGKQTTPVEKWLFISPYEKESKTINLEAGGMNGVKEYQYILDGIYRLPADMKGNETAEFVVPAAKNEFKTGNYTCSLIKTRKTTDESWFKFDCTYHGDQVGFVFPARCSVKMPDGNTYAIANSKLRPVALKKGESTDFVLEWTRMPGGATNDMQIVPMLVQWPDVFVEISPEKVNSTNFDIKIDQQTTDLKGK